MEYTDKLVDFHRYCKECIHYKLSPTQEPCNTCLGIPANEHSRKPVHFKEDTSQKKQRV